MATFHTYFEEWLDSRKETMELDQKLEEMHRAYLDQKKVETNALKMMSGILHNKYGLQPAKMVYHYQGMAFVLDSGITADGTNALTIIPMKTLIDEDQPTIIEGP